MEAANKLRGSVESAEYKHLVLRLLFLKYTSDAFELRRAALEAELSDPKSVAFVPETTSRAEILEDRDGYAAENVFWVLERARWPQLLAAASQPDLAKPIDDALEAIERDHPASETCCRGSRRAPYWRANGSLIETIAKVGLWRGPGQAPANLSRERTRCEASASGVPADSCFKPTIEQRSSDGLTAGVATSRKRRRTRLSLMLGTMSACTAHARRHAAARRFGCDSQRHGVNYSAS